MPDAIEHVIVLMLENRSFDHFFGAVPGVDGVDPHNLRSNFERPGSTTAYFQNDDAWPKLDPDPKHETENTLRQIEGETLGPMGGFVYDFARAEPQRPDAWPQVMAYFRLGSLPAIHELAQRFCVCDRWYASVPGPTWTNRFFAHSGTSQGRVKMPEGTFDWNLHPYDQTTVYDRLNERGITWRIYFGDIAQSLLMKHQRRPGNLRRYSDMSAFWQDVNGSAAEFPQYVFIEPSYFGPEQNDQHPPCDVARGDALVADVYNAVRANEALWDSTLLIVLWDEHGGFYDHCEPPRAVPPDNHAEEYSFDRYGVRVPAMLISKWVQQGTFRAQQGELDHTSILRYLSDKFGLGALGARVASAATFASAITNVPNQNVPDRVGTAGARTMAMAPGEDQKSLSRNQAGLLDFSWYLETEMGAHPAEVGERTLRALVSTRSEIEVAKERVREYIRRNSGHQP